MIHRFSLISFLFFSIMACTNPESEPHTVEDFPIVPLPQSIAPGLGFFQLNAAAGVSYEGEKDSIRFVVDYLNNYFRQYHDLDFQGSASAKKISLKINPEFLGDYHEVIITQKGILIQSGTAAGLFYGAQSLLQLSDHYATAEGARIPCGYIKDEPRFSYRGMHLDVGRHFFPVEFIKQYIDLLAHYKMNRFHWHLTEDQGWRIEIKKYPKLQEVAAYRSETLIGHNSDSPRQYDGQRYGGFYTQQEVKDVVDYAARRFVTIIPEIELPGHAQAAIAAYPELSCHGQPVEPATHWGVFENIYCPTEETFTFLQNVLTEVMELFPSTYIHIGGDEAPKKQWEESSFCQQLIQKEGLKDEHELQSYFIRRIEKFLNNNGRRLIGWDEILEGGLAPNATVMSWRGEAGGVAAARQGHDVIMTPTSHCYLDYYQSLHPEEPLAIGGYLPLEYVYNYHPVPEVLDDEQAKHILGTQGNLWTEYIPTPQKAAYMAYPRMMALAEVNWLGDPDRKDYANFIQRLAPQILRWQKRGINMASTIFTPQPTVRANGTDAPLLHWENEAGFGTIRYRTDEGELTRESKEWEGPTSPDEVRYRVQTFLPEGKIGRESSLEFVPHQAINAKVTLPQPGKNRQDPQVLVNGLTGNPRDTQAKEWFSATGQKTVINLELPRAFEAKSLSIRFLNQPWRGVIPPIKIELFAGEQVDYWTSTQFFSIPRPTEHGLYTIEFDLQPWSGRFLQMEFSHESGQDENPQEPTLVMDEIRIQ